MLAAASDVLAESSITAATGILAAGVPPLVVKLTVPWMLQKIPHIYKMVIIFILFACGLLMLVVSSDPAVRLAGIGVAEVGTSLAEITLLSLTAFYSPVTTSAFATGLAIGSMIGPLYYTATVKWFCVVPRVAIAIILPGILLFLFVYAFVDRSPLKEPWAKPSTHKSIKYELLAAADQSFENKLTWSRRCVIGWLILPLILFLYCEYVADYLSNYAVVTTLAFKSAPFRSHEHYNYYSMCDRLGNFLGCSYLLIFSYTCPSQVQRVRINKTWILALIVVSHNLFLVTMSWYRFVPQVGVTMALCFTGGFAAGAIYVNSAHVVRDEVIGRTSQEFALSLLTVGISAGLLAGGLLGLYTELALKEHCLYALKLKTFCSSHDTRKNSWIVNHSCN
ncbi:hypothetical protein ACROYT_G017280 [Oculina patagonica]